MHIALRSSGPIGAAIRIDPARALPLDWEQWQVAQLGGAPLAPIAEEFTAPEGWSIAIAEVAAGEHVAIHAFYSILDHAVHAHAVVHAQDVAARAAVRAALCGAAPIWDDEIVALGDL